MKAVLYSKYGHEDALTVEEIERPTPLDKQVLVKVHAASINAGDWRGLENPLLARVIGGGLLKPKNTRTGSDLAGKVEAVGLNVTQFKPGDEVFGCGHGSFAEYVLAREAYLSQKPSNISFEQAATVPIAALTALQAIRHAGGIRSGQMVLVQGASGGVGIFTLQLAKLSGAEVTAVCSTKSLAMARSLGADHVIDYTRQDFTRNSQVYDLIFGINGYHPLSAYKRALSPGGTYVCVGGSLGQFFQSMLFGSLMTGKGDKKLTNMGIAKVNQEDLMHLAQLLDAGKIAPVIDCSYPLSRIVDAFKYVLVEHPRGKVVITLDEDKNETLAH
jgi:NADPH:quinone reductase-like Zn-dependent oxidoreductase